MTTQEAVKILKSRNPLSDQYFADVPPKLIHTLSHMQAKLVDIPDVYLTEVAIGLRNLPNLEVLASAFTETSLRRFLEEIKEDSKIALKGSHVGCVLKVTEDKMFISNTRIASMYGISVKKANAIAKASGHRIKVDTNKRLGDDAYHQYFTVDVLTNTSAQGK